MNDLISRAAAIKTLNMACEGMHAKKNYFRERAYHEVVCYLEKLPAVDAAPAVHGQWVSVKDRMPPEAGWYWVYAPYYSGGSSSGLKCIDGVMFARWSGKAWSIEVGYHKRPGCVTHWMPIPDPPKEG